MAEHQAGTPSPQATGAAEPTVPSQRRFARLVPARSEQAVLLHALREARDPEWVPETAAARLLETVGRDLFMMRLARARLRGALGERVTVTQTRTLITLDLAIDFVSAASPERGEAPTPDVGAPAQEGAEGTEE